MNNKPPIYIVDAFTKIPFKGNPAAVCILDEEMDENQMQTIAAEMNLSETAFVYPLEDKTLQYSNTYSLRWFTPKTEVPLCGHATLASAAVLFNEIGILSDEIIFKTLSGNLIAKKENNGIRLNFPIDEPNNIEKPTEIIDVLAVTNIKNIVYAPTLKKLLVHLNKPDDILNINPDFEKLLKAKQNDIIKGVIVTAQSESNYDFISRYFAPWVGINEDPVTGSAHTVLAPYWSKVLEKTELFAYQASDRGGEIKLRLLSNNRVDLIGNTVIVLKGELYL